jgi:hypothetical protein
MRVNYLQLTSKVYNKYATAQITGCNLTVVLNAGELQVEVNIML